MLSLLTLFSRVIRLPGTAQESGGEHQISVSRMECDHINYRSRE